MKGGGPLSNTWIREVLDGEASSRRYERVYITHTPFYNFPYTFGYLFALSLFAKAKELGQEFENAYIQLLRDSGKMSMEELVLKHLNEDITSEVFWEKGIKLCVKDVEDFLELTGGNNTWWAN